jgi:hypothetical protein
MALEITRARPKKTLDPKPKKKTLEARPTFSGGKSLLFTDPTVPDNAEPAPPSPLPPAIIPIMFSAAVCESIEAFLDIFLPPL